AVRFKFGRTFGRPSLFWPANSAVQIFGRRPDHQIGRLILAAFGSARLGRCPTLSNIYDEETLKNFNSDKSQHTEEIKNPKPIIFIEVRRFFISTMFQIKYGISMII
ncbi:hypothetical protein BpHYR1_033838, partial [Brachionus plicatilis]